jgi:hypothetical protein
LAVFSYAVRRFAGSLIEEAGQTNGARGFDILLDHGFTSFSRQDPALSSGGPVA